MALLEVTNFKNMFGIYGAHKKLQDVQTSAYRHIAISLFYYL